jgi:ribosomal protein L11 methyltransferase
LREIVLRVPRRAVEDVLDRLLPLVPQGVREVPAGRHVELRIRGTTLPGRGELKRAAGRWPHKISEREVPDDWRARRVLDYKPDLIGGRLVVRPEWAPGSDAEIEIVLGEGSAFGAGTHPTTRTCLEMLLKLEPEGTFADLGCGSGVLAILASKLGWSPVIAVDIEPRSIDASTSNAKRNGTEVEARLLDLSRDPPPISSAFAANVPAALHLSTAANLPEPISRLALLSGFAPAEAGSVVRAYLDRGMREVKRLDVHGWTVLLLAGT